MDDSASGRIHPARRTAKQVTRITTRGKKTLAESKDRLRCRPSSALHLTGEFGQAATQALEGLVELVELVEHVHVGREGLHVSPP